MSENDEIVEGLIRRHRVLGADLAEIKGEMDGIKNHIDDLTEIGWSTTIDGLTSSKRAGNRSFSSALALMILNEHAPEKKPLCVVTRYDDRLLRQVVEDLGLIDDAMVSKEDAAPVLRL